MFVVAITRWNRPFEQDLAALSKLAATEPANLKLRLSGPLPIVFSRVADAATAREMRSALQGLGHGAIACDAERITASQSMITPKTFSLGEQSMTVDDPAKGSSSFNYSEALALVHASVSVEEQKTVATREKKFSLGRALLTGGIVLTKSVAKQRSETAKNYEQVLYIYRIIGDSPLFFRQNHLLYSGLKERMGHSSAESFANLVAYLRQRARGALYDNRLVSHRRKPEITFMMQTETAKMVESSNLSETDLAAYLIAMAHHQGQL